MEHGSPFYSSRDAEAQVFALDAVSEMILGNRFLQMKQSGLMAGMPFEALLLLGFNTTANEFSSTQLSNFGTGTLSLSGGWNKIYQNINLYGKMKNPGNGETVWVRQTLEFKDKNTLYISNYDRTEGMAEYLSTEYIFTRK